MKTNTKTNTFINNIKEIFKQQKGPVKESAWVEFLKDVETHILKKTIMALNSSRQKLFMMMQQAKICKNKPLFWELI